MTTEGNDTARTENLSSVLLKLVIYYPEVPRSHMNIKA